VPPLSLAEILDGLHERFRLLVGGARTAARRQQTLRGIGRWISSHATQSRSISRPMRERSK
jgi:predicted ATPase